MSVLCGVNSVSVIMSIPSSVRNDQSIRLSNPLAPERTFSQIEVAKLAQVRRATIDDLEWIENLVTHETTAFFGSMNISEKM